MKIFDKAKEEHVPQCDKKNKVKQRAKNSYIKLQTNNLGKIRRKKMIAKIYGNKGWEKEEIIYVKIINQMKRLIRQSMLEKEKDIPHSRLKCKQKGNKTK